MGRLIRATLLFLALSGLPFSCAEGTDIDATSSGGAGAATAGTAGAGRDGSSGSGGAATGGVGGSGGSSGTAGTSGETSDGSIDGIASGGSGAADAALDQRADAVTNPCAGVVCNTPPANYCVTATTLRTYSSSGTCSGGNCSYGSSDTTCPYGCSNGVCRNCMIDADCGSARWCSADTCIACNTDQHCGTACTNCTAQSRVCSGGTTCVECTLNSQCGAGRYCNNGTCAPCDVAAHCGASCVACSGSTPSCVAGSCSCVTGSCPSNQTCSGGACTVCKSDSACGATCAACGGSTPRCLDQGTTSSCVQCLTGADCSGGLACSAAHTCGASCVPPATACSAGGSADGGCSNALRISRTTAGTASGFTHASYGLCLRSNNFNGGCDARNGSDAEYRIFMRQGETAAVTLTRGSSTCVIGWSGSISLRIYQDTCSNCASCPAPTCGTQVYCMTGNTQTTNHVAPADGWYTLVVDSNGPVEDKGGIFTLNVKLTCTGTCGC